MTLRFVDSYDDRDTAHAALKYTSGSGTIIAGGRNGSKGVYALNVVKSIDSQGTWIIGMAVYPITLSNGLIVSLTDIVSHQMQFILPVTGFIFAQQGYPGGATFLGVSSIPITTHTWWYVEFKVKVATHGTIDIHINGVSALSLPDVDTQATSNPTANAIEIHAQTVIVDDLYICDDQGARNNDFLGDNRVDAILPNGVGTPATAEWASSGGGASVFGNVDDNPPDDDTTYNYADEVGLPNKDVWAFPAIASTTGLFHGVQVNTLAKKMDAGGVTLKHIVRTGGPDYESAAIAPGTTTYQYYSSIWEQDPDGPADWDVARVNAAEFGYERTA